MDPVILFLEILGLLALIWFLTNKPGKGNVLQQDRGCC